MKRVVVLLLSLGWAMPACRAPVPPPPSGGEIYRGRLVFQFEGNIFYPCNQKGGWWEWEMPSVSSEQGEPLKDRLGLDPRCRDASPLPSSACDADAEVRGVVLSPDPEGTADGGIRPGSFPGGATKRLIIYQLIHVQWRFWTDCNIDYSALNVPAATTGSAEGSTGTLGSLGVMERTNQGLAFGSGDGH